MGLFTKPAPEDALASTNLSFAANGDVHVEWHGDPGLLIRTPALYLDWALNKEQRRRAEEMLSVLDLAFTVATPEDAELDPAVVAPGTQLRDAEVIVAVTEKLHVDVSFRPRTAITSHLFLTFSVLWSFCVRQLAADGAYGAIESLLDDMRDQLELHQQIGLGMRAGKASLVAYERGAGRRLKQEIAAEAGLTVEQFDALSEDDRNRVLDAHTQASIKRAGLSQ